MSRKHITSRYSRSTQNSKSSNHRRGSIVRLRPIAEQIERRLLLSTTWTVNTLLDETTPADGRTSLREAIAAAASGDSVQFASTVKGTITLKGSELLIGKSLTINGPGSTQLAISGNNLRRIFEITSGSVTINGLSLTGGNAGSGDYGVGGGGAIINRATLALNSDSIRGSKAFQGGGIYNRGTLVANSINVSGNFATHEGGGIYNCARATLNNSTLNANTTGDGAGGGVFNIPNVNSSGPATLTLFNVTVSSNVAATGGGGVLNWSGSSTVSATDTTFSANKSSAGGGGAVSTAGTASFLNCTLAKNSISAGSTGGAIYARGTLTLSNSTVTANTAPTSGVGAGLDVSTATAVASNTIVSGNTAGGAASDIAGALGPSSSYNLIGVGGGLTNGVSGNKVGITNPKLGSLQNNSGPTFTMLPQAGSPAIDSGNPAYTPSSPIGFADQRGLTRLTDGNGDGAARLDIGAVETAGNIVVTQGDDNGNGNFAANDLTLREAVRYATVGNQGQSVTNTIAFSAAVQSPINLQSSLTLGFASGTAPISLNLTIKGRQGLVVTDGGDVAVFVVDAATVAISGLSITGGGGTAGGGISVNSGTLTLTNVQVTDSNTHGIYNRGKLSLANCVVSDNKEAGLINLGTLTVTGSAISDNAGGGIDNRGTLTLNNSIVNGNVAMDGGGIYNSGPATISNSTITGNTAYQEGAAVFNAANSLKLVSTTVTANQADTTYSGGITIAGGSVSAQNSILSGNFGLNTWADSTPRDVLGSLNSASSYNLIGLGGGLSNGVNGNIVGVTDPRLGALKNNGGATATLSLLADSPAIDAGDPAYNLATSPTVDQRGFSRLTDGNGDGVARIDIGAIEVASPNLLKNADFSAGRTGFATQYLNSKVPGGMIVAANPTTFTPLFSSFGDHTSGKGQMLIADGSLTPNQYVWQETVAVANAKDYVFSGWATSAGQVPAGSHVDPSPAKLAVYVNGVKVGTTFTVPSTNGSWGKFIAAWHADTTTATIKIVDLNTTGSGNDFALDDLSFRLTPNLLVNSRFSAGKNGFASQYANAAKPGGFIIGRDPKADYGAIFKSFGDHTSGTGLMIMADGATAGAPYVWQETISVDKYAGYDFGGFATSMDNGTDISPAQLAFYVNGTQMGAYTVGATGGIWGQFYVHWNSGSATSATIKIVDLNHASVGNDFALDDLSFVMVPNLLKNGDFSAGNVGFSSQYVNAANAGGYIVGRNPHTDYGAIFKSFGDHTSGTGNMLMVDGSTAGTPRPYVWQETISVAAGANYDLSGYTAAMGNGTDISPARLALYVNGVQIGGVNVGATGGAWAKFLAHWNSGSSTSAVIKIVDLNSDAIGNDFVLDDLLFNRT